MGDVIVVDDLTKEYRGVPALKGVSFRLITDESLGLVGPMGAGKSTLIKILAGVVRPTAGQAFIDGQPVTRPSIAMRRVGVVLDKTSFYPELTASEMLAYIGRLRGMGTVELPARIKAVLEQVGLKEWRDVRLGTFSRGMQQRLALAQAILHEPRVLILDEVTSGLDPNSVAEVVDILKQQKREGRTILLTAHSFSEVADVCDSLAILHRGRLLLKGDIEEVVRGARSSEIEVRLLTPPTEEHLRSLGDVDGVRDLEQVEPRQLDIRFDGSESDRSKLLETIQGMGLGVCAFKPRATLLEEAYDRALSQETVEAQDLLGDPGGGGGGEAGGGEEGAGEEADEEEEGFREVGGGSGAGAAERAGRGDGRDRGEGP